MNMTADSLHTILIDAQRRRDAGDWEAAILLFGRAEQIAPHSAEIKHNLALAHFARGDMRASRIFADQAISIKSELWQSSALLAKIHRNQGDALAAQNSWNSVLDVSPGNGAALLGLADLCMNEFGDAEAAMELVRPLSEDAADAADAELTSLMASLYAGGSSAEELSKRLINFSETHLRLPRFAAREPRQGRRRVGLISPLFSYSPVYHLTHSTFTDIARDHDLVFFNRTPRQDSGTVAFHALATEWHEAASMESLALAHSLAQADLDILFDLGGWSDVPALLALSSKPAARMYKWVGGQSATTGLDVFDGWIGDELQSPRAYSSLYSEPLLNIAGGYVDYTAPPTLAAHADLPKRGVGLVGNPVKIGRETIKAWPTDIDKVKLIDRRYVHDRTRERVVDLLARSRIEVEAIITPEGHDHYLQALAGCSAIVNTQPYSAGLTAIEARWLGVEILSTDNVGKLFCSRHHLSHARTGGRNRGLTAQLLKLVSE